MINKINKLIENILSKSNYEIIDKHLLDKKNIDKIKKFLETLYLNKFYKKRALKAPTNKKILILAPHPDDEVLGCGGLLLSLIKNHCEINIFCLTSGQKNEQKLREKEFKSIWKKSKIKHYNFFRFKDNELFKKIKDIKTVRNKIIDFKPDIILTPFVLDDHIDHTNTNKVFVKSSKEFIKTKIWSYQVYSSIFSNYYFDITRIQKSKFELMKKYKSQMLNFDYINWNRGLNAWSSRFANKKKIKFVENYYINSFENYSKICKNYFSKKIK